ncbi:MAG: CPBP family intramembrane metalloprotease, partial [Candidatus Thermoplasmatota archaeon]|nr:CPBP family intramembrane metalloprotease [Candidatus Thermoplasmatota archaeon]
MSKTEYLKTGLNTVCLIAILCYFIVILFSVVLLFPSLTIVLPELLNASWTFFIITPYMIPVFCFKGYYLLGYYLFVVSAILLSFVYMIKKEGKQAFHLYSKFFEKTKHNNNSFFLIPQIFLGLVFFDYAYDYIIRFYIHVTPKTPSFGTMPLWKLMFSLSNASVHEEIVSRIMLIGIPLLLIDVFRRRKIKIRKYFLGGNFDINPVSLFLIIFSSLIFSYAHVFGWDFYKILPVFVTGIALGYLFLKKGVYAC